MSDNISVNAEIAGVKVELPAECVSYLASAIPECLVSEWRPFILALTCHPAACVRRALVNHIGDYEGLPEGFYEKLAGDKDISVREAIANCANAIRCLPTKTIKSLVRTSVEAATSIAVILDDDVQNMGTIALMLAKHSDPGVRKMAAKNEAIRKKTMSILKNDPDPGVRFEISIALKYWP